ncbi:MAG: hypothetical protein V1743_01590 [Nanoarchaeota archaeon]
MARETIVLTDPSGHKKSLLLSEELLFKDADPRITCTAGNKSDLIITIAGKDEKSMKKARTSIQATMTIYDKIKEMTDA